MATKLDQPRVQPLEIGKWDTELKKSSWLPEDVTEKSQLPEMMAKVFNVTATLANHPTLAKSWNQFAMHIMGTNSLEARIREIAIIRIGYLNQSDYELSQHAWIGEMSGLTQEEIIRITEGPGASGWSNLEALTILAADELKESGIISTKTWDSLIENGLSQQQMMDLVFTIGQYNMVSWALNSLGVQLDEGLPSFFDTLGK
ncbi:MAG: carboxymuconolactone decarboxylase family protein [Pseudomonadales bacterium]|nr:carboxymuconolactone decarboxylase family protein [Pseudomonadales bacterium]